MQCAHQAPQWAPTNWLQLAAPSHDAAPIIIVIVSVTATATTLSGAVIFFILVNIIAFTSPARPELGGTSTSDKIFPLPLPSDLCPNFAMCLCPLDDLSNDYRGVIHFTALPNRRLWHSAVWSSPSLCM